MAVSQSHLYAFPHSSASQLCAFRQVTPSCEPHFPICRVRGPGEESAVTGILGPQ